MYRYVPQLPKLATSGVTSCVSCRRHLGTRIGSLHARDRQRSGGGVGERRYNNSRANYVDKKIYIWQSKKKIVNRRFSKRGECRSVRPAVTELGVAWRGVPRNASGIVRALTPGLRHYPLSPVLTHFPRPFALPPPPSHSINRTQEAEKLTKVNQYFLQIYRLLTTAKGSKSWRLTGHSEH